MKFMHSLREHSPPSRNTHRLEKLPKTFRTIERRSVCEAHERKRVSDFSPESKIA